MKSEQQMFGERFHAAVLRRYGFVSQTRLMREYALAGGGVLTAHAVRKWLFGESIPTQARLRVLASMLGVSLSYLRFGEGSHVDVPPVESKDMELQRLYSLLSTRDRHIVLTLARALKNSSETV